MNYSLCYFLYSEDMKNVDFNQFLWERLIKKDLQGLKKQSRRDYSCVSVHLCIFIKRIVTDGHMMTEQTSSREYALHHWKLVRPFFSVVSGYISYYCVISQPIT